jgi:cell shape-determining protein MreC
MTGFQFREVEVERTDCGLSVQGQLHRDGLQVGVFLIESAGPIAAGSLITTAGIDEQTSARLLKAVYERAEEHDRAQAREEVLRN